MHSRQGPVQQQHVEHHLPRSTSLPLAKRITAWAGWIITSAITTIWPCEFFDGDGFAVAPLTATQSYWSTPFEVHTRVATGVVDLGAKLLLGQ